MDLCDFHITGNKPKKKAPASRLALRTAEVKTRVKTERIRVEKAQRPALSIQTVGV